MLCITLQMYTGYSKPVLVYYFILVSLSVTTEWAVASVIVAFHGSKYSVLQFEIVSWPVIVCIVIPLCELQYYTRPLFMCSCAINELCFVLIFQHFNFFKSFLGIFFHYDYTMNFWKGPLSNVWWHGWLMCVQEVSNEFLHTYDTINRWWFFPSLLFLIDVARKEQ